MLIVHGTARFRDRVPGTPAGPQDRPAALLGSWYATVVRWRPAVALFVEEVTLLPLLVSVAPARTLLGRLPDAVAELLAAHRLSPAWVDGRVSEMGAVRLAPTANRSVVGVMNEFGWLADAYRPGHVDDLIGLSVRLAATPCGPLYGRHVSPDRELAALADRHSGG